MSPTAVARLSFIYLFLNLVVFAGYGVCAELAPAWFAHLIDISLDSRSALADFRAMYGGLPIVGAVVFVRGMFNPKWRSLAISFATLSSVCLGSSRILAAAVDGPPTPVILVMFSAELFAVIAGVCLLRLEQAPTPSLWSAAASSRG